MYIYIYNIYMYIYIYVYVYKYGFKRHYNMFTGPLIACGCDDTKIHLYSMDGEKVVEHT